MATEKLAHWAVGLTYSNLPNEVVQSAVRSFYNWAGCAIGGSSHPTTTTARKALAPFFGKPTSTLLGQNGDRTDASHAALINGIASHVHDYDDTHLETIIHPTGPVASALLAHSEALGNVKPDDFIVALVAGIEAECKVGLGVWPKHYDIGWHITSTTGTIGAAVAISKLLHLDTHQTQHAIGLACTQVTGLREMFGSDTKSFHVGRAAQNGLLSAILASHGYTSSLTALEAKRGWINVVSQSNSMTDHLSTLGSVWEITKNAFKPFPCGIVVHPIIDGCIQLHRDHLAAQQTPISHIIKSVHLRVHPLVLELTGKKTPTSDLQAKFSVYHGAAIGLALGKATPAQYETPIVLDPAIVHLRSKIDAVADPSLRADEAVITLVLFDSDSHDNNSTKTFSKHVDHAIGSLEVPMTHAMLEEKFLDQVCSLGVLDSEEAAAEKASDACWKLRDFESINALMEGIK